MKHLMLDIETLGDTANAVILSIGAVQFDLLTGETGATFHKAITIESCQANGMVITASTLKFWLGLPTQDARTKLLENQVLAHPLTRVLFLFAEFIRETFGDTKFEIWGKGPLFDMGILGNAYSSLSLPIPWDFRNERCVRTLLIYAPNFPNVFKFEGTQHSAVDDCYHQIKYIHAIHLLISSQISIK